MQENSNARALMAYSFLVVFGNDDTVDADELGITENLALRNNAIDGEEKQVPRNRFARVDRQHLTEIDWQEIRKFRRQRGI